MKKNRRHLTALAAVMLAASLAAARGQEQRPMATKPKAAAATKAPVIDPEAVAAVEKMEAFVKTLTAYSVRADTTTDEVLLAGPKVQFGGTIDAMVRLPNRLRLTVARDDKDTQEFFYDGSTLAVWIKDRNVWASAPVAPTVGEMAAQVRAKYALSFPLDDLLRGASHGELLNGVTAGVVVGTGIVAGVDCDHLGFHREGIDAQIWIEKGNRPLPRKFVITTLGEPSQPQHSEVLTWDLSPKIDEARFTFTPPAGAEKIVFAEPQRGAKASKAPKTAKKEGSI
ncbi:MAG: DUF2092 domain-containing protein [Thermoanaerobaculia bacterium]